MKKGMLIFLLMLNLVSFVNAARFEDGIVYFDKAVIPENYRNSFWVGEEVSIPLKLDCWNCANDGIEMREWCNCMDEKQYKFVFENGSASIDFALKRKEGSTDSENNGLQTLTHWKNKQSCWVEFVGTAVQPGLYSGHVTVKTIKQRKYSYTDKDGQRTIVIDKSEKPDYAQYDLSFSFEVKSLDSREGGTVPPNSKATIVSRDVAASYLSQAEIYSYLKNNTGSKQTLDNPFMDYYMTLPDNSLIYNTGLDDSQVGVFSIWKLPKNSCMRVLYCGNGNYVLRHKYKGVRNLEAGMSLEEFQLALYNVPSERLSWVNVDVDDLFEAMKEKSTDVDPKEDYSYLYPAEKYPLSAARNEHYNYKMASFEKDGSMLYGSIPNWFNSSCREIRPEKFEYGATGKIQYRETSVDNLIFCDGDVVFPKIINGSDPEQNANVRKEDKYTNLAVKFRDIDKDSKIEGSFAFQVSNSGNEKMPIGGYEMFFYYFDHEEFEASKVNFYDENLAGSVVTKEMCSDGKFALKIKLGADAVVDGFSTFPENEPIWVDMDVGGGRCR